MNTTRAPPPQGAPPAYAMVTKVYRRSLRPIIFFTTFLGGLWALLWGIDSFRDISIDSDHAVKLKVFDIVLGVLYMVALAVELFGFFAAFKQNLKLIRVYAFASLGAAVIAIAIELMRVIIHFAFKNTLINECEALANGQTIEERFGFWFHTVEVNSENAPQICQDAWSHDSFSEIAWFIVTTILSLLFASLAFSYYRQMLDPTFSRSRNASASIPAHYNPPYAYGQSPYGQGGYAPPSGPPPAQSTAYVPQYDPVKLPEYDVNGAGAFGDDFDRKDAEMGKDARAVDPFADFRPSQGRRDSGEGSRERNADRV